MGFKYVKHFINQTYILAVFNENTTTVFLIDFHDLKLSGYPVIWLSGYPVIRLSGYPLLDTHTHSL